MNRIFAARILRAVLLIVPLVTTSAARADEPGASLQPVRVFDLETTKYLGRKMYEQDQVIALASTWVKNQMGAPALDAMHAYALIFVHHADGDTVRFVAGSPNGPRVYREFSNKTSMLALGADARPNYRMPSDYMPGGPALLGDERAQFDARLLASKSIEHPCAPVYNTLAMKEPNGSNWLVWVMAASKDPKALVLGGHYRFTISADGHTIIRRDELSRGCMIVKKPDSEANADGAGVAYRKVVSLQPDETDVFASLTYHRPIYVGTADGNVWRINGDAITNVTVDSSGEDGASVRALEGLAEDCHMILSKSDNPANFVMATDATKVVGATEGGRTFAPQVPAGMKLGGIACARDDIVPLPNDYKVVRAGYMLGISDGGTGHPARKATLTFGGGHFAYRIEQGDPPDAALQARIDARLAQFEKAVGDVP